MFASSTLDGFEDRDDIDEVVDVVMDEVALVVAESVVVVRASGFTDSDISGVNIERSMLLFSSTAS